MQEQQVIEATRRWVERFVIAMNLCPFVRREVERGSLRFSVTDAGDDRQLLQSLHDELELIGADSDIETTLLIHPSVLQDFGDYNQFLGDCEELLRMLDLEGVFQIASFHPRYRFAGTDPGDAENFTNRSPYPMLHILRESSVAKAVDSYPDVEQVPSRNIVNLNAQGTEQLTSLWKTCFDD